MEIDKNILERVNKITGFIITNPLSEDDVIYIIENLSGEVDRLEEELEDLKEEINENYKPYTKAELYGVSDKDFL